MSQVTRHQCGTTGYSLNIKLLPVDEYGEEGSICYCTANHYTGMVR
jgi:hypothetical protein